MPNVTYRVLVPATARGVAAICERRQQATGPRPGGNG